MGSAAGTLAAKYIKNYKNAYDKKAKDDILDARGKKLGKLYDKYDLGSQIENTPETQSKYRKAIFDLIDDSIAVSKYLDVDKHKLKGDRNDPTDIYQVDIDSVYYRTIIPFVSTLRMICIPNLYISLGQYGQGIRRDFELIFDPDNKDPRDIIKDPFRMVVFRQKWPAHGFMLSSKNSNDANILISRTVKFLSENPKYLTIRV